MAVMHDMLKLLHGKKGSDLYIAAGTSPKIKVHGKLVPVTQQELTPDYTRVLIRSIMNDKQAAEFEETNECNFAIGIAGVARFRINAYMQRGSAASVIRLIADEVPSFEDLMLPPKLADIIMVKRGLVIMVGGTGAGKSSTLAAMIDYRNRNSCGHIITIEDPVEFTHEHKNCIVSQREVGSDTDDFDVALKNTLRQAPDVILIGEIRDQHTMEQAIVFAETGHLCLATLHANNTNQAMDRIINFFPEGRHKQLLLDLSLNLQAVVSQRLIPTIDGKSRRAAFEILLNTPLMADLILNGEVHGMKDLMKRSREHGMKTFDDSLFDLLEEGAISMDDALKNADSANDLRLNVKLNSKRHNDSDENNVVLRLHDDEEKSPLLK